MQCARADRAIRGLAGTFSPRSAQGRMEPWSMPSLCSSRAGTPCGEPMVALEQGQGLGPPHVGGGRAGLGQEPLLWQRHAVGGLRRVAEHHGERQHNWHWSTSLHSRVALVNGSHQ